MTKTKYHSFKVDRAGNGQINMLDGNIEYFHEDVSAKSNSMGISIIHHYSKAEARKQFDGYFLGSRPTYGFGFNVILNPAYDENSNYYKNKVQVYFDSDGTITSIRDRKNPSNRINFIYEDIGAGGILSSKMLRSITDTNGKVLTVYYDDYTPCRFNYSDGQNTRISYTSNVHIQKIVGPTKTGVQFTYDNGIIASIRDIFYYTSVTDGGIQPSTTVDLSTTALDSGNRFNFEYATAGLQTLQKASIMTRTEVKTGNKSIYCGIAEPSLIFSLPGPLELVSEEHQVGGKQKSFITYEREALSNDRTREHIYYNTGKDDETYVRTTCDKDEKLLDERVESYFNKIIDGEVGERLFKRINKVFTYSGKKVKSETTTLYIGTSKTALNDIEQKSVNITYEYESGNDSPVKITCLKDDETDGIVQQMLYDASGNIEEKLTYHSQDPNIRFVNTFEHSALGQITSMFDERGNKTGLEYEGKSNVVTKITDPCDSETAFELNDIYKVKNMACGNDKTSISRVRDFVTSLSGPDTVDSVKYNFEYFSKTPDFKSKQTVKINDVEYLSKIYKEESNKQISQTSYASGEKLEATDLYGNLTLYYYDSSNNKQQLISSTHNTLKGQLISVKDNLAKTTTNFSYDKSGNVIASENQQLKTAVSTDDKGNITDTEFVLKEL